MQPKTIQIRNAVLPKEGPEKRFDVSITGGTIYTAKSQQTSGPPTILLPALCHPHIHLDKAYLLTSHPKPLNKEDYPDYSDLSLEKGDFSEALAKTSEAKTRYTIPGLILRGSQLIAESVQAGVTSIRAFAEVDHATGFKCIEAAIELKRRFRRACYIQICAFAQDPIVSKERGGQNLGFMEEALDKYQHEIEVLGTTPYVEGDQKWGKDNIEWAIKKAIEKGMHLDFHLDYNTQPEVKPLVWEAIKLLKQEKWIERTEGQKRVVFGHCSRLTIFDRKEMDNLVEEIADLPVAFVGLPTSDLFMMGRLDDNDGTAHRKERGTLQVVDMIQRLGLQACIGVNNVGNAFTPWGSADPLRLASLGVGLYQAGTPEQARILYECVSTRARRAIGLQQHGTQRSGEGEVTGEDNTPSDFDLADNHGGGILAIMNEENIHCLGVDEPIPMRQRLTVTDVVWDPPEINLRQVYHGLTVDDS